MTRLEVEQIYIFLSSMISQTVRVPKYLGQLFLCNTCEFRTIITHSGSQKDAKFILPPSRTPLTYKNNMLEYMWHM